MKAREVLNELKWRKGRDIRKAVLYVKDRSRRDLRTISGSEIAELGKSFFSVGGTSIPYYKIEVIEYEGSVVYRRRSF